MARDFWMYQARDVAEPFAAHIWLFDSKYAKIRFYAEYVKSGAEIRMVAPISLRELFKVFEGFAEKHGWELNAQDYDQIETLYEALVQEMQFLPERMKRNG